MPLLNIKIPDSNPLHFTDAVPATLPQYNYKHFRDWPFPLTIRYWETPIEWFQPWQQNDAIRLQLLSEVGPVYYSLVRHSAGGQTLDEIEFQDVLIQKQQSRFVPGMFIHELDLDLSIFDEGFYSLVLEFGSPVLRRVVSNVFMIQEKIEDSIRIDYRHRRYFGDMFFETGFYPHMRTYGTLQYDKPGSINVLYNDQKLNLSLISGKPFNDWRYYTGGPEGLPDFMVPKLNQIFCMTDLKLEGIPFTKSGEGTTFEEKAEEGYPMRGWSIALRDKMNQLSRTLIADTDAPIPDPDTGEVPPTTTAGAMAVITVDTKGFVDDDNGGSFYNVIDIE